MLEPLDSMYLIATDFSAIMANIGQFILAFSILVVLHEMGHFFPAKWFGCRVDKFYLFFNPWFSLWKKKVGETEYGLGWIPLGGYVKIAGMIDESMDKEQMNQPAQPWEFRSKPAWQRLIIMIGGVVVNFILAFILFAMILFVWGEERLPVKNLKYGLSADSLATTVGIQDGDVIKAVNGKPLVYMNDLAKQMMLSEQATLQISRNGRDTSIKLPSGFISKLTKNQLRGFVSARFPVIIDTVDKVTYTSNEKLQKGDRLLALNNVPFQFYSEFDSLKQLQKNKSIILTVERIGGPVQVGVKVNEKGSIGFLPVAPGAILGIEKSSTLLVNPFLPGSIMGWNVLMII